jgi:hypothetical protein
MPQNGHWLILRKGAWGVRKTFATKSEAVAAATALARKRQPSQVIILYRNGGIQRTHRYGLPRRPERPYRSAIAEQIERAVLKVSGLLGN